MARFEQLKPKLKECSLFAEGSKLVVEDARTREHLVLPISAEPYIRLMDGTRTIQEIIAQLHRERGGVRFKILFTTFHRLATAGLIAQDSAAPTGAALSQTKAPFEKESFVLQRPLFRVYLSRVLAFPSLRLPPVFTVVGLAMVALAAWAIVGFAQDGIPNRFLQLEGGGYGAGIVYFFACASLLLTLGHAVSAALLLLATGRAYNPSLDLTPLGLSLHVDDDSIYLARSRGAATLFHLASALAPMAAAGVIATLWPEADRSGSLRTIATFLVLLELNPYSRSDLTNLFHLLYQETLFSHLVPYLRNRALLSFTNRKDQVIGEVQLLLYSACAIGWTVGSLTFASAIIGRNFPNLMLSLHGKTVGGQTGSAAILLYLGVVGGYLAVDLLRTFVSNLIFPMTNPLLTMLRSVNARPVGNVDLGAIQGVLREAPLFSELADATLAHLASAGTVRSYRKGTALVIQGAANDRLHVLLAGSVRVQKREPSGSRTTVCELETGAVLGEVSCLQEKPATADVIAAGLVHVLELPREVIRGIPGMTKEGAVDFERISAKVMLGHYIASSALFHDMPGEVAQFFASRGTLETTHAGVEITRQGAADRSFFLVIRGKAEVRRDGKRVGEVAQGGFFGEIALITGRPRTASVLAAEECVLLKIDADALWQVLSENIRLSLFIETVADSRLGEHDGDGDNGQQSTEELACSA